MRLSLNVFLNMHFVTCQHIASLPSLSYLEIVKTNPFPSFTKNTDTIRD